MSVKDRIKAFADAKGVTYRELSTIMGASPGYINSISKSIQPDKMSRLSTRFPDLNVSWLLTGEGEMLHRGEVNVGGVDYNNSGGNHTHTHNAPLDLLSALNKSQALVEQSQSLQVKSQEQIDRLLGIIEKMQSKE